MGSHWAKLGKSLERSVEAYNNAIGSLEGRVLVTARKFVELESHAFGVEIETLEPVDIRPRPLEAPETSAAQDDTAPQL